MTAVLPAFILSSCISYDADYTGVVGEVIDMEGIKVLVDPGADALIAIVVRNDNTTEGKVSLRAVGGEIGYRSSSSSSFGSISTGNTRILAGWLLNPSSIYLESGEEILMTAYLNNWHLTTRKFSSRIEIIYRQGEERSTRLTIVVDENDVFEDASRMIQSNKLGQYNPSSYGARNARIGWLPADYELTIPPAE